MHSLEFQSWKSEQISYFRGYLNNFNANSEEYKTLIRGITELEKAV
jgi:hypothetical protein